LFRMKKIKLCRRMFTCCM